MGDHHECTERRRADHRIYHRGDRRRIRSMRGVKRPSRTVRLAAAHLLTTIVLITLLGSPSSTGKARTMSTLADRSPEMSVAAVDIAAGFRPDPGSGGRRFVSIGPQPISASVAEALRQFEAALAALPGGLEALAWCEVAPDGRGVAAGIGERRPLPNDSAEGAAALPTAWIWPDWRHPDERIELTDVSSAIFRSPRMVQIFSGVHAAGRTARLIDLRAPAQPVDLPLVREGTLRASDSGRWAGVMHDGMLVTGVLRVPDATTYDPADISPRAADSIAPNTIAIEGSINDLALLHGGALLAVNIEHPTGTPDIAIIPLDGSGEFVICTRRPGLMQPVWGHSAGGALLIRTGHRGEHPIALLHVALDGTLHEEAVGFDPVREHPVAISPSGRLVWVRRYASPSGEHHVIRALTNAGELAARTGPAAEDGAIAPSLLEPRVLWLSWP